MLESKKIFCILICCVFLAIFNTTNLRGLLIDFATNLTTTLIVELAVASLTGAS